MQCDVLIVVVLYCQTSVYPSLVTMMALVTTLRVATAVIVHQTGRDPTVNKMLVSIVLSFVNLIRGTWDDGNQTNSHR